MLVKDFFNAYYGKLKCIVNEVDSEEPLFSSSNRDFLISLIGDYVLVQWDFEVFDFEVFPADNRIIFHLSVKKPEGEIFESESALSESALLHRYGFLTPEEYERMKPKVIGKFVPAYEESYEEFEERNQAFLESLNDKPDPSKYDNHDIRNLKLPARVMNRLTEFGIESVGDLRNFSRKDLLEVKGLAKRGVDIIEHRLCQLGLSLKADQ